MGRFERSLWDCKTAVGVLLEALPRPATARNKADMIDMINALLIRKVNLNPSDSRVKIYYYNVMCVVLLL
jgi:hypothetical protein